MAERITPLPSPEAKAATGWGLFSEDEAA